MTKQYDVGYGKPPNKHQFKKGKSGNPSGKPKLQPQKPAWDFQKNLIAELKSLMTITENGKKKKISKKDALVKSIVAEALKGDKAARKFMMDFLQKQPQYAFEDEEVVHTFRITKKQMEHIEKFVELTNDYDEVFGPDSNQEQGNGSPSSPAPSGGSGSASTDT
jgi:Family of unknown function (DUF5681)